MIKFYILNISCLGFIKYIYHNKAEKKKTQQVTTGKSENKRPEPKLRK